MNKRSGFVYVVHTYWHKHNMNVYKIGRTGDFGKRFKQLERSAPTQELTIVHVVKTTDAILLESALHQLFSSDCVKGEWFCLSEEQVLDIRMLGDGRTMAMIMDVTEDYQYER